MKIGSEESMEIRNSVAVIVAAKATGVYQLLQFNLEAAFRKLRSMRWYRVSLAWGKTNEEQCIPSFIYLR